MEIQGRDFEKIEFRVGTVVGVFDFPEARKPAFILHVDLGELGIKKTSAQLTALYSKDELQHRQVLCVCNIAPKQIGPFMSEILVTGFSDGNGAVILAGVERNVPNGTRLS